MHMARIERAAGGLVVRVREAGRREVLLIDDAYGHVTFPKGHVEPGETWEAAAIREIREETGIEARILAPLGRVEYPVERDGQVVRKQVRLFLLEEIDEADDPVPQVEEVRSAYFLPWHEAEQLHAQKGYANWSWVFAKADVLWRWHHERWEAKWRELPAKTAPAEIDARWQEVQGLVRQLCDAVRTELAVVAPDLYAELTRRVPLEGAAEVAFPQSIADVKSELRQAIEHTLLKPEASALDIEALCREAVMHQFRTVCVNPQHVRRAADSVADSGVIPCTVIGFPLGAAHLDALVAEARAVVAAGAREVDMVLPIGSMREDDIWTVFEYVRAVCEEVHRTDGAKVKVIFENHFLTYAQVAMATLVCAAAGADFVKTSTGFAASGAKLADVALMAYATCGRVGVKAAGGIRTTEEAVQFLRYGASRLGTSSGTHIVR
jgi:deoxyribose-phosphate aldolase